MPEARALWHMTQDKSSLKPTDKLEGQDCLVQSLYSLISTGTERLVARGHVPISLQDAMCVPYMEGNFGLPIKYGYSLVGKVIEGPEGWLHKRVHLLHPHQDYCRVNANVLTAVDEAIPSERACLASNMETALNAIWDSQVSIGDSVLLVGFGIIGALTASLLKSIPGITLSIFDKDAQRAALAESLGFRLADTFHSYDMAFHCSGNAHGLQLCIDQVGKEGKVIELSWYGEQEVSLHLGGSFHYERKQIISSQVSQIPADRQHRWDYQRRKSVVMDLLKNPFYDQLIGSVVKFEKSPALFDDIRQGKLNALSWLIDYT